MRQHLILASASLAALAFAAAPAAAQNKQMELEWLRLEGATFGGQVNVEGSGRAVASAGDVNHDGFDDMLVGAYTWDTPSVDDVGRAYLAYGGLGITGAQALPGSGAVFQGEVDGLVGWQTGLSVAGVGDVNGDTFGDFLIGAPMAETNNNTGSGRVYLVYGGPSLTGTVNLASFTGGVVINGANASDQAGSAVAGPGDVNGDNIPDLLIGASGAENGATSFAGAAYIIYGSATL
ncbi:MAG TPA: integrin alpha, partial [Planctomycetota bacterium]|nr:integrin alpha [Planctomycetota bacterium]